MTAVVTANGLGLFNSSQNLLGGSGLLGQAGGLQTVNAATGNLVLQAQDEVLVGKGLDLLQLRTYNSSGAVSDADGDRWRWDFERNVTLKDGTLNQPGSSLLRTTGDGHQALYRYDATQKLYISSEGDGAHDRLQKSGDGWLWQDGNRGVEERYGADGRLQNVKDRNGNQLRYVFVAGRLSEVQDLDASNGLRQKLQLGYRADGKLETLSTSSQGQTAIQVYYGYDAQGRLATVKTDLTPDDNNIADGKFYSTTYSYDGDSLRIASVSQSDGTQVGYTYHGDGKLKSVVDASGTTSFSYAANQTTITNGSGQIWLLSYDAEQRLTALRSPAINGAQLTTAYSYDGDGNLKTVTNADGKLSSYDYDANGNLLVVRDALGNTISYRYNSAHQLLTETRYRQPDPDGNGPLPASGAETTRYVYDAQQRLRFVLSPEGRVSEQRYDSEGQLVASLRYRTGRFALSGFNSETAPSEAQLQSWLAGIDKSQAQRTNYSYDLRGQLERTTEYATLDSSGNGVLEGAQLSGFIYDSQGLLRQSFIQRGAELQQQLSQSYDGLGRLVSRVDGSGTSTILYNGNARTVTTSRNGITQVQSYDAYGRVLSVSDSAGGVSASAQSIYNAAGQLRATRDASGALTYYFYDSLGRLSGTVNAAGLLTEQRYNNNGQVTQELRYATAVASANWLQNGAVTVSDIAAIRPTANLTDDRRTERQYDAIGRLVVVLEFNSSDTLLNLVTTYDGVSRITATQRGDRNTRYYYDNDGRQVGVVDAEGYLTETSYDDAGNVVSSRRYATPIQGLPTAKAGPDQTVEPNKAVSLDGMGHDSDGQVKSYQWSQLSGPKVNLANPTSAQATFTSPADLSETTHLVFRLTVTDDAGQSSYDDVVVTVGPRPNQAPHYVSGLSPYFAKVGTALAITIPAGSFADPNGDGLIYRVGLLRQENEVVEYETTWPAWLTFDGTRIKGTPPANAVGRYILRIYADDKQGGSCSADFSLQVLGANESLPPRAYAGADQRVRGGKDVVVIGRGEDDDGQIVPSLCKWEQLSGPPIGFESSLLKSDELTLRFSTKPVTSATVYRFRLTVTDSTGRTSSDEMLVTVVPNGPPVANAGDIARLISGKDKTYTLDGSRSVDTDGDAAEFPLTYRWELDSPAPPGFVLRNANSVRADFDVPIVSSTLVMRFKLTVTDNEGRSSSDTVVVLVDPSGLPQADAGSDKDVRSGSVVNLTGKGRDTDGAIASWDWRQISGPEVTIANRSLQNTTFTAPIVDRPTLLIFELTITDNTGRQSTDRVIFTVQANTVPLANAGRNARAFVNTPLTLDGSASYDPDSQGALTYQWRQVEGEPTVTLSNAQQAQARFVTPNVSTAVVLVFELTVTDAMGGSSSDRVVVVVEPKPLPVANAGSDANVRAGESVRLNGGKSYDVNGGPLSYQWRLLQGPAVQLNNPASVSPDFIAPTVSQLSSMVFELTVTDNDGNTNTDTVVVNVSPSGVPIADPGPSQHITSGAAFTLDGSASQGVGGVQRYAWRQVYGPPLALGNTETAKLSLTAPVLDTAAILVFELTITDSLSVSSRSTVEVHVAANKPPVAVAGNDIEVNAGQTFTLDGLGSFDPDGSGLSSYRWEQIDNSGVTLLLTPQQQGKVELSAPLTSDGLSLVFRLTVTDAQNRTHSDLVTVRVKPTAPPRAVISVVPAHVGSGKSVRLDGRGSVPTGQIESYRWVQLSPEQGLKVELKGANSAVCTLTTPKVTKPTLLHFRLTVTTADGISHSETVTVRVEPGNWDGASWPIADAGRPGQVASGGRYRLDGSASSSPIAGGLRYHWAQEGNSLPKVGLDDTERLKSTMTFTAPPVAERTVLVFELTVWNVSGQKHTSQVAVTVEPSSVPMVDAGPKQTIQSGASFNLVGKAVDTQNLVNSYSWVQQGLPKVTIANPRQASLSLVAPRVAEPTVLYFELTAVNQQNIASTSTVQITVLPDAPPFADAGADQVVRSGQTGLLLNAGASNSTAKKNISYSWRQIGGDAVGWQDGDKAVARFDAPIVQTETLLVFEVMVRDDVGRVSSDTVVIKVLPYQQPQANAGVDASVAGGKTHTLNGAFSVDPDRRIRSYQWVQKNPGTTPVTLDNPNAAQASFKAPALANDTVLTFELTVVGDNNHVSRAQVLVTVKGNGAPVAVGRAQLMENGQAQGPRSATLRVASGASFRLDAGDSSDPEGALKSYRWVQVFGEPQTLPNPDATVTGVMRAPAVKTDTVLRYRLTVVDAQGKFDACNVDVIVEAQPAPVAIIDRLDGVVANNKPYQLNGLQSTGTITSYHWEQLNNVEPFVNLSNPNQAVPSFIAPAVAVDTLLLFRLTVRDVLGAESTARVSVMVLAEPAPAAVAVATPARVMSGDKFTLDGLGSTDNEGVTSWEWRQVAGQMVMPPNGKQSKLMLQAPTVSELTSLKFELTVTDRWGFVNTTNVLVVVYPTDGVLIDAGNDQQARTGDVVVLSGSGKGFTGVPTWRQVGTPAVAWIDKTGLTPRFTAPAVMQTTHLAFLLEVVVDGKSYQDDVWITVMPKPAASSRTQNMSQASAAATPSERNRSSSNPLPPVRPQAATVAFDPLAALRPAQSADDSLVRRFYNGRGQLLGERDGQGFFSAYSYDEVNNSVRLTRSSVPLTGNDLAALDAALKLDSKQQTTETRFDGYGRTLSVKAANGSETRYYYDAAGRLSHSVLDNKLADTKAQVRHQAYSYDAFGRLQGEVAGEGARALTDASSAAEVLAAVAASGTQRRYDSAGRLISSQAAGGRIQYFYYDTTGRLAYTLDNGGAVERYSYNTFGEVLSTIRYAALLSQATVDSLSGGSLPADLQKTLTALADRTRDTTTTATYNQRGQVIQAKDAEGGITFFKYNGYGELLERKSALSVLTRYEYDRRGLNTAVVVDASDVLGANDVVLSRGRYARSETGYDFLGRVIYSRSARVELANETRTTYSESGRTVTVTNAAGASVVSSYDGFGRLLSVKDALQQTTRYAYSFTAEGSTSVMTAADGSTRTQEFNRFGELTVARDGLGQETRYEYNANGQLVGTTDALKQKSENRYDARGRLTRSIDVYGNSSWLVYDVQGRVRYTVAADGAVSEQKYDGLGRIVETVRYAKRIAVNSDVDSLVLAAVQPVADPANDQWTYSVYDRQGRLRFSLQACVQAGVKKTTLQAYEYDSLGQLTASIACSALLALPETRTVAALQTLLQAQPEATLQRTRYSYNKLGQRQDSTDALGKIERYRYDNDGNRTQFTNKKGLSWSYQYDKLGRLTDELSPNQGFSARLSDGTRVTQLVTHVEYDANNNVTARTEAYGTIDARRTEYRYNANGQQQKTIHVGYYDVTTQRVERVAGANRYQLVSVLQFDANGQAVVNSRQLMDGDSVYGEKALSHEYKVYDALGRVQYEVDAAGYVTAYSYEVTDAGGKLQQRSSLVRYANAITLPVTEQGKPLTAARVEALLVKNPSQDRVLTTEFDKRGRKSRVVQSATLSDSAAPTTLFEYDSFGRVLKESRLISAAAGWADTQHFYDQYNRETATVDAEGYLSTQQFDALGNLKKRVEYAQRLSGAYTPGSNLPAAGDARTTGLDRTVEYVYDKLNRRTHEILKDVKLSADGTFKEETETRHNLTTRMEYDALGNVVKMTDASGAITVNHYDALGRLYRIDTPQRALLTRSQYDGSADPFLQTTSLISSHWLALDAFGAVVASATGVVGDVGRDSWRLTWNSYDAVGNRTESVRGLSAQRLDNDNELTSYGYNALGKVVSEQQTVSGSFAGWEASNYAYRISKNYEYDTLGRQTETRSANATQKVVYNAFGEITTRELGAGVSENFNYNTFGQLIGSNQGDGVNKTYSYDLLGNLLRETRLGDVDVAFDDRVTVRQYDKLGRVTRLDLPTFNGLDGAARQPYQQFSYDRWGNVLSRTDLRDANWVTSYQYDQRNLLRKEILPKVAVYALSTTSTEDKNPENTNYYDAAGRMVAQRDAAGNLRSRGYDTAGNVIWTRDATGNKTEYAYNAHNERVATKNALGAVQLDNYDRLGRLITSGILRQHDGSAYTGTAPAGTQYLIQNSYRYDQAGRRIAATVGDNRALNAQNASSYILYDAVGNVIKTRSAAGYQRSYSYDALNRKTKENILNSEGHAIDSMSWSYKGYQLSGHTDLGKNTTNYSYDGQGQLKRETYSLNNKLLNRWRDYDYYSNGLVKSIIDIRQAGSNDDEAHESYSLYTDSSLYDYDKAGNRTVERNSTNRTDVRWLYRSDNGSRPVYMEDDDGRWNKTTSTFSSFREVNTRYDALGRIESIASPQSKINDNGEEVATSGLAKLSYYYDIVGNRRGMVTQYYERNDTSNRQEKTEVWYDYDAENRLTYTGGRVKNGQLVDGTQLTYDKLGRRSSSLEFLGHQKVFGTDPETRGRYLAGEYDAFAKELYGYDDLGNLIEIKDSSVIRNVRDYADHWGDAPDVPKEGEKAGTYSQRSYDLAGRQLENRLYNATDTLLTRQVMEYNGDGQLLTQKNYDGTTRQSFTHYDNYDAAGNLLHYRYQDDKNGIVQDYSFSYTKFDTYKEWTQTVKRSGFKDGVTTSVYDQKGNLQAVHIGGDPALKREYVYNREGQILFRLDSQKGKQKGQDYYYVNGKPVASIGQLAAAEFDYNYTPVSGNYPARTPGSYVVNAGDTLRGIASALYGDAALWYLIADANSLGGDEALTAGQSLTIPNVVSNIHNNSSTFKPYNPGEVIGDITPSPIPIPPPSDKGCSGVAMVIMVAVAVVATVFTAGAAATVMAGGIQALGATTMGAMMTAGTAALAGGSLAAVGAAFVGGVMGSVASQLVGKAMGAVEHFSLRSAVSSGIASAAMAGLGSYGSGGSLVEKSAVQWGNVGATALRGMAGYGASYAANKIAGVQTSFSWGGVAASALGAVAGRGLVEGLNVDIGEHTDGFINGALRGGAMSAANRLLNRGGKVDWAAIATDAFANEIGNSVAKKLSERDDTVPTIKRAGPAEAELTIDRSGPQLGLGAVDVPELNRLKIAGRALAWNSADAAYAMEALGLNGSFAAELAVDSSLLDSALLRVAPSLVAGDTGVPSYLASNRIYDPEGYRAHSAYLNASPAARQAARTYSEHPWTGPARMLGSALSAAIDGEFGYSAGLLGAYVKEFASGIPLSPFTSNTELLINQSSGSLLDTTAIEDLAGVGSLALKGFNGLRATNLAKGSLEDSVFAQVPAKPTKAFSEEGQKIYSQAAGRPIKTVNDLADALRQGAVTPSQVPLDYVVIDGQRVIANTRSSTALINAEIPKSQWYGVNKTGVTAYSDITFDELVRNQLNKNYAGSVSKARR